MCVFKATEASDLELLTRQSHPPESWDTGIQHHTQLDTIFLKLFFFFGPFPEPERLGGK